MTKLEAVNEVLEKVGEPPISALDTNGTSEAGEAETILDRETRRVLQMGWAANTYKDYQLYYADTAITVTGTGTFTYLEKVSQAVSGATGRFIYLNGSTLYLRRLTGTFDASNVITGQTSGATRTASGSVITTTTGRIAVPSTWYSVRPSPSSGHVTFSLNGVYLFNTTDNANTFEWGADIKVDAIVAVTFTDLTYALADLCVKSASLAYARYKKRSGVDEQLLRDELDAARAQANRENNDMAAINLLNTAQARRVTGNRRDASAYFGGV
jgi:hypothetical protein